MPFSAKYLSAPGCQGMPALADLLVLDLDVERLLVDLAEVLALLEHGLGELVGQILGEVLDHGHDVPDGGDLVVLVLVGIGALRDDAP